MTTRAAWTPGGGAPSPALQPPPGNPRFALFDGLRAIAILAVVAHHAAGLGGTWGFGTRTAAADLTFQLKDGVTLFFVISGFLLYRPFVAARAAARSGPSPGRYARRRVLRIVPGYWVALTLLALVFGLPHVFSGDFWIYYGFLQGWSDSTLTQGLSPAWSLTAEAGFYVVLPVYAAGVGLLASRLGSRGAEWIALAGFAAIGLGVRILVASDVLPWAFAHTIIGTTVAFAVGMALAIASVRGPGRALEFASRRPEACWAAALLLFLVYSLTVHPARHQIDSTALVPDFLAMSVVAGLVALPAVVREDRGGLPRRILGGRAMAFVGLVSYGLFLYHFTILNELEQHGVGGWLPGPASLSLLVFGLAAGLLAAVASYYVVELPFLRRKEGSPVSPARTRGGAAAPTARR